MFSWKQLVSVTLIRFPISEYLVFVNSHSDEIQDKQLHYIHISHVMCCLSITATGNKEKVITKSWMNIFPRYFQDTFQDNFQQFLV